MTDRTAAERMARQRDRESGLTDSAAKIRRKELNAKHQAALRERERAAGIIRKLVRIPEDRATELDRIVAEWKAQHAQRNHLTPTDQEAEHHEHHHHSHEERHRDGHTP